MKPLTEITPEDMHLITGISPEWPLSTVERTEGNARFLFPILGHEYLVSGKEIVQVDREFGYPYHYEVNYLFYVRAHGLGYYVPGLSELATYPRKGH